MECEHTMQESQANEYIIELTDKDRKRIHRPWACSVIVKLTRKKVIHEYLKQLLAHLWKPSDDLTHIDLDHDYFIVKFLKEKNMLLALYKGTWFINGFFLLLKK